MNLLMNKLNIDKFYSDKINGNFCLYKIVFMVKQ